MDRNLTYAKTPAGEEATRQRTRVVQRNLRMVLLQVDGQVTVDELIAKIGNEALVINALKELEKGGYVCLAADAPSVWEQSKTRVKSAITPKPSKRSSNSAISAASALSGASDFSGFESEIVDAAPPSVLPASQFSTFGQPVPAAPAPAPVAAPPAGPGLGEKLGMLLARVKESLQDRFVQEESSSEAGPDLKPVRKIKLSTLLTSVLAVVLVLIGGTVFLFPYNSYRPDIEKALSQTFGMPVRVANVEATFLPRPGLLLTRVELGGKGEARFGQVLIPQLLSLGSGTKTIRDVVVSNAVIQADFLSQLDAAGKQMVSGAPGFQLAHAKVNNLSVVVGDLTLSQYSGEASFGKAGLENLMLENEGRTLRLDIAPQPDGVTITAQGFGWKLGADDSSVAFAAIQAKGVLQPGKLSMREIDGNVLNGNVVGNLTLDWTQGLKMAGELQLTRLSTRQISTAFKLGAEVDGDMSGMMRYASAGEQWSDVWRNLDATLAMTLNRGAINGVDLGEAARRGGGKPVAGGATRFERLSCTLRLSPQGLSCPDIDLDAGLMSASGQFVASRDKAVAASLQVQIKGSVTPLRVEAKVSGTLPRLETSAISK